MLMTLLEQKISKIQNGIQQNGNYVNINKTNIQNWLTSQFITINKSLIEVTKDLVSRKEVI